MKSLVNKYKHNITIRTLAGEITRNLKQKHFTGEVIAIQDWVKNEVRYTKDVNGVETIQTPIATLNLGYGDCDDKSTLTASLLESIGHRTRFVACGFKPNNISHVYVETKLGMDWVAVETTEPVKLGWAAPGQKCRMVVYN